jgi:3',5'-cyclic AMP phosphodiesterase CpdA
LGHHITPQRRERYRAHWGPDWWSRAFGDWRLLGLNCLLFDTRLDEERAQWDWLADELLRHRDRPVGLFMHKPLFLASGDEEFENDAAIPRAARRRMAGLLKGSSVRLIASGHRHEYRTYHWNGIAIVWAPTTSFIANRRTPLGQEGIRRAGCVQYEFFEETCVYRFVEPEGIEYFDDRFLHELRRDRGLSYDPQVFR